MISILLATYNGEKYIKESVDSIINQTFTEWELLVGFNGTTDSSKEIINKYNDSRIRIFDYDNDRGKAKTLNKLIQEAKYEWCAIQDDDDTWLPEKLKKQIEFVHEYDVIGTFINYIDENNQITGKPNLCSFHNEIVKLSLSGSNQIANTSVIFKKQCALDINGWKTNLDGIEDFDFWLRLIKNGKKFINIPEYITLHRIHGKSNFNTQKYDLGKIL